MTAISWKTGQSDSWTDPSAWSTGTVPGSTDDVTIGVAPVIAGLPYTITLSGSASVQSVTQSQALSVLAIERGVFSVAGTYSLAGTISLNAATLQGGSYTSASGAVLVTNSATLSGLAWNGTLDLQPASVLEDNSVKLLNDSFSGLGGSGQGSLVIQDIPATLGTGTTLGDVAVSLVNATLETPGGTLSIGAATTIHASGYSEVQAGTLVSLGQISASDADANLTINVGSFSGHGTMAATNGGRIIIVANSVAGAGLLSVGAGSFLGVSGASSEGVFTNTTYQVQGGTLALDLGLTTAQLGGFDLANGTLEMDGVLNNSGATLRSGAGTGIADFKLSAGTITGGTIVNTGAFSITSGAAFGPVTGAGLTGVTVQGGLDVTDGAAVSVKGLTLTGLGGSGAGSLSIGNMATLTVLDTETLNTSISIGSTASQYGAGTLFASGTLALGAQNTVTTLGSGAELAADTQNGLIINEGTITNASASGSLTLDGLTNQGVVSMAGSGELSLSNIVNIGTIADAGGQISVEGSIDNTGLISISGTSGSYQAEPYEPYAYGLTNAGTLQVSNGATVALGGYENDWTNTGVFSIVDAELSVSGLLTLADLGVVQASQHGTLGLTAGTLNDVGTLTIGQGTNIAALALGFDGVIQGGTVVDRGGSFLGQDGTLSDVTFDGVLALSAANASVSVADGTVFTGESGSGMGSISVTGIGSSLDIFANTTLDHIAVSLGSAGPVYGASLSCEDSTLTLGPDATVTQTGALATLVGNDSPLGGLIVNEGRVTAAVAGGIFTLVGAIDNTGTIAVSNGDTLALQLGALTNTGTISVRNGAVEVVQATAAQLAELSLADSSVLVTGTLTLAGSTLSVGAGGLVPLLKVSGTILGGTVHNAGGVQFVGTSTLNGVTEQGPLTIGTPFSKVSVDNGLTLQGSHGGNTGSLALTGAGSTLAWASTQALDHAVLSIGSNAVSYGGHTIAAPSLIAADLPYSYVSPTVLLGSHLQIQQAGLYADIGGVTDDFSSAATLTANVANGQFTLQGANFTNSGTIGVSSTDTVLVDAASFTNAGLTVLGAGSALDLDLYAYFAQGSLAAQSFTNTGTLMMAGGMVAELTDNGAFPNVKLLNAHPGHIVGAGVIASQIDNTGIIEASGGVLNLAQQVSGTGAMQVDAGATLVLGGVGAGQTVSFSGAGGVLGLQPAYFLGTVGGFASGDTIDLFNTSASSAAFSGRSIVVTLSNGGTLKLATTSALSGSLTVTAGTHGDELIRFAGAGAGIPALPHVAPTEVHVAAPVYHAQHEPAAPSLGLTYLHHAL